MSQAENFKGHELSCMAHSASLRKDMRRVGQNRTHLPASQRSFSFDEALRFLSQINAFANHPFGSLRKIKGDLFIF